MTDELTGCKRGQVHDARKYLDIDVPIHPRVLEDQGNDFGAVHIVSKAASLREDSTYKVAGSTRPSQYIDRADGSIESPTTSAPTGATQGQMTPANMPKRA